MRGRGEKGKRGEGRNRGERGKGREGGGESNERFSSISER